MAISRLAMAFSCDKGQGGRTDKMHSENHRLTRMMEGTKGASKNVPKLVGTLCGSH